MATVGLRAGGLDPVSGCMMARWTVQPVAAGLAAGLLVVAGAQLRVWDETPWPAAGWAVVGIVAALIAAAMLTAGWWRHDADWTRRGYFMSFIVFAAWALVVFHSAGPLVEVGLAAVLSAIALLSWRAEVEARWLNRPKP